MMRCLTISGVSRRQLLGALPHPGGPDQITADAPGDPVLQRLEAGAAHGDLGEMKRHPADVAGKSRQFNRLESRGSG